MWKELDPSKIVSSVCLKCAACCKHTVRYDEKTERYALNKIEYLMAMFGKPREDFGLTTDGKKWRIAVTWNCVQLNPDKASVFWDVSVPANQHLSMA